MGIVDKLTFLEFFVRRFLVCFFLCIWPNSFFKCFFSMFTDILFIRFSWKIFFLFSSPESELIEFHRAKPLLSLYLFYIYRNNSHNGNLIFAN